jgi:hypothetical protein
MNAQELAAKFAAKIAVAAVERDRQAEIAVDNVEKRTANVEHCKRALEQQVLPFLEELKHHMGSSSFRSHRKPNSTTTVRSACPSRLGTERPPPSRQRSEIST